MGKIKKVLLAKPGLDGHDVGVKVVAHALKENGYEVLYTGLRKTIEHIVERAKAEKPDIIGLSILSGTHVVLCQRMREVMQKQQLQIPWFIGGNIPAEDVSTLEMQGAAKAFPTGTSIQTLLSYIQAFETSKQA